MLHENPDKEVIMKGKIDFKKEYKFLFSASAKEPQKVDVPDFKYLMIGGRTLHPNFLKKSRPCTAWPTP
jgi:hypothetical protein